MDERARQVLEIVERDSEARGIFVAAFGERGDGLSALREAVEPDVAAAAALDDRVARLRRLAFGRTETDEDEATAADARRELEEIAAGERTRRDDLDRAVTAVLEARAHPEAVDDAGITPDAEYAEPAEEAPRPRRAWLLPAIIGLVVGALVVAGLSWMFQPIVGASVAPTPDPTSTGMTYFLGDAPESTAVPGDLQAAERWFEPAQTDDDLVGVGELRPEFDRASVRLVHNSPLARVWVAKQVDGDLCLETTETETQITSGTCATTADFATRGLSVSSNVLTTTWNGAQLRVVLARR